MENKKSCKNCGQHFVITSDDLLFYEKIGVPWPTRCPECRYQRRLANRNEWNFYKRNCSLCGTSMVSIYNPAYPGPVYCQPCYWSDRWDTLDYGRDFDFSRPFFEQFKEHRFNVPQIALTNEKSVNSEYTNQSNNNRNCYVCVACNQCEYCMFGNWNQRSKECVDCWCVWDCELMYESLFCEKCYHCAFLNDAGDCHNIYFCDDMVGCSDCFGCVGLRKKSYCWFNEQLTKEEYKKRFAAVDWSWEGIEKNKERLLELRMKHPVSYFHGDFNINSSGDYIDHNKNVRFAFNAGKNENAKYLQDAWEAKDCMDLTETLDNELEYELEGAGWSQGSMCTCKLFTGREVMYSERTFNSEYIFGCVSVIKKKYCIFNKQYTPEEFKDQISKIKRHMRETKEWGEFFPIEISPFPYNDTVAQDYFPMTKEQVLAKGWQWYDKPKSQYQIGGDVLQCTSTIEQGGCAGVGAFRLHPTEVEFYKKMNLSTPRQCWQCRLKARLARRNPRKLWKRNCMQCNAEIETSYSPERPEIVYCEQCYNRTVS